MKVYPVLISIIISLLFIASVTAERHTTSWHDLSTIYKTDNAGNILPIDADGDNIIDAANTLTVKDNAVKIGVSAESTSLEIIGAPTLYSAVDFYSGDINFWGIGRNPTGDFYIDRFGDGNVLTIDESTLYVGIGTESPNEKLEVVGNVEVQNNNEVFINIKNTETGGGQFALVSAGSLGGIGLGKFSIYDRTASMSRLTIDTSGNVGIGNPTPAYELDVSGQIHATGDICTDVGGGECLSVVSGAGLWALSGSNVYYTDGNVGVGTATPSAGLNLDVEGKIGATQYCDENGLNCKIISQLTPAPTCVGIDKKVEWDGTSWICIEPEPAVESEPAFVAETFINPTKNELPIATFSGNGWTTWDQWCQDKGEGYSSSSDPVMGPTANPCCGNENRAGVFTEWRCDWNCNFATLASITCLAEEVPISETGPKNLFLGVCSEFVIL